MRLHHVGIAVRDLEAARARYALLGYRLAKKGEVPEQEVRVYWLEPEGNGPALELLAPTAPETPVGRFLEKRGEGIHHLAFATPEIKAALARLKAEGLPLVDETPRAGFGGHRVAFLHPRAFLGVLVELVEE